VFTAAIERYPRHAEAGLADRAAPR
jgi:hypothetical protein